MRVSLCLCLPLLSVACAGAPPAVARAPSQAAAPAPPAATPASAPATAERAEAVPPEKAIASADAVYRDQLAIPGRDARFSVDRQIVALERAIDLYKQFLERAGDEPRYAEAAQRSRDRIADAEQTIAFLREQAEHDQR